MTISIADHETVKSRGDGQLRAPWKHKYAPVIYNHHRTALYRSQTYTLYPIRAILAPSKDHCTIVQVVIKRILVTLLLQPVECAET